MSFVPTGFHEKSAINWRSIIQTVLRANHPVSPGQRRTPQQSVLKRGGAVFADCRLILLKICFLCLKYVPSCIRKHLFDFKNVFDEKVSG